MLPEKCWLEKILFWIKSKNFMPIIQSQDHLNKAFETYEITTGTSTSETKEQREEAKAWPCLQPANVNNWFGAVHKRRPQAGVLSSEDIFRTRRKGCSSDDTDVRTFWCKKRKFFQIYGVSARKGVFELLWASTAEVDPPGFSYMVQIK